MEKVTLNISKEENANLNEIYSEMEPTWEHYILPVKDFNYEYYENMWGHFRCKNELDKSKVTHLTWRQQEYLKNPSDEIYNELEPFFKRVANSIENLQLFIVSNILDTDGLQISKVNGNFYMGKISKDVCEIIREGFASEGMTTPYIFYGFRK